MAGEIPGRANITSITQRIKDRIMAENTDNNSSNENNEKTENINRGKNSKKNIIIFICIAVFAVIAAAFSPYISSAYQTFNMNRFEEYASFISQDGEFTVSLRTVPETALTVGMKISVYLIDNTDERVRSVCETRVDADKDQAVDFSENGDIIKIDVSGNTLEIDTSKYRK